MNRTPSDKNSSSETKEIENCNEETLSSKTEKKLHNKGDPTIIEGELFTTLNDKAKNEIPSKGGDTVIDILTEKHLDSIIEHRRKSFWVYFGIETNTEPVGATLDYGEGDRNDFVRLVFLILTSMLAVTTSYVFMVMNMDSLKNFLQTTPGLIIGGVCLASMMAISYAFACSNCTRQVPTNWITIVLTTIVYTYAIGYAVVKYEQHIVLCAAGTTLLISAICLGLAFTSIDFTKFLLVVMVAMISFLAAASFLLVLYFKGIDISLPRKIILILSTITSAVMLVIEFQMILGGKTVELGEEDYCYAAYMAYTSIVDLFIKLLRIYSEFED